MFPLVGFVKKRGLVLEAPLPETKRKNKNLKKKQGVGKTHFLFGIYVYIYTYIVFLQGKLRMSLEVHFLPRNKDKKRQRSQGRAR